MKRGGAKKGERRGGRKKGVPNKMNIAARLRIETELDPIGLQMKWLKDGALKVGKGAAKKTLELTPEIAAKMLGDLTKKVAPDQKAVEHSVGEGVAPVTFIMGITR